MKHTHLIHLRIGLCFASVVLAASLAHGQKPVPAAAPDTGNGIAVSGIKIYDNAALQQMLDNARARLAGMNFLDSAGIASRIGGIQGSTMQQSGLSVNVGGPSIPGLQTTANTGNTTATNSLNTVANANSATSNSQTQSSIGGAAGTGSSNQLTVTAPTTSSTTTGNNQTQVTGPSTQTVSTLAQQNPSTPALPTTNSFTAPSGFAPSASNILNEQVQLTSEVAGLALLLEGALSDQAVQLRTDKGETITLLKRRVTIGIPISIVPSAKDKDAVAEIILTVTPTTGGPLNERPSITAILPQDKTYNVATVTSKSVNLGGGAVTGVLTAGVNFMWQKQTYYIVQAQDTVALQLPPDPSAPDAVSFGWQLRPVLGAKTVSSGMRTLFVQLAFPPSADATGAVQMYQDFGTVTVTTGWKRINPRLNTVFTSYLEPASPPAAFPIKDFNLEPRITNVFPGDNGDGTVTVHLETNSYVQNTYIKIAGSTINQGAPNALFNPSSIDFTVPALVLATQRAYLVDRSGAFKEIVEPMVGSGNDSQCLATVGKPTVVPETATTGKLTIGVARLADKYCPPTGNTLADLHLVALLGNKVFGLRDAPLILDDKAGTVSFRAPIDLLRNSPTVTLERLLWGTPFKASADLTVTTIPTIDKATVVAKSDDNLQIALIGSNLQQLTPPAGMAFNADGKTCTTNGPPAGDSSNTGRILCVPKAQADKLTNVALRSDSGDLLLVALPTPPKPEPKPKPAGPTLQPQGAIDAGVASTLTVKGTHLDGFDHVEVAKKKIPAELSSDKTSIAVHLPADAVQPPKIVLVFFFKNSKNVSYTVKVNKKDAAPSKP
ncbi:MAG TPA: hypothetical protein VN776_01480 [Terracidiphilus sp.]|nr:hypothetical protein [Terracidiphilus sp.]